MKRFPRWSPAARWPGVALLGLLLVLAFWNVVFAGRSLVYSDNLNPLDSRLLEANYGPGFAPVEDWARHNLSLYPNWRDYGANVWQWEPAAPFLRTGLARGELPFWDPFVAAGAPAMANLTQAFWFPPHLLVVLLGDTSLLLNLYQLLLALAAGGFTYLFLLEHGLGRVPALVGGAAFMLSGAVVQTMGSFMGQPLACLPLVLLLTRRFLDRPSVGRGSALVAATAATALASFPPLLVEGFGLAAAYAVTMTLAAPPAGRSRALRGRTLAAYAGCCLLAAGLVAFYYLPAAALLRGLPQVEATYHQVGRSSWVWESLYQLASPMLMGGEVIFRAPLMPGMEPYYLPYLGFAALMLLSLADRRGEGSGGPLFAFTATAAALLVLKILGVAPVQWLGRLPVLSRIHIPNYFGMGLCLLLAVLAAIGTENLAAGRVSRRRLATVGGLAVVALCSLLEIAARRGALRLPEVNRWLFEWAVGVAFVAGILSLATLAAFGRARGRRARWIAAGALLLVAGEGARHAYYPRQVRGADVFHRPPPYVRALIDRGRLDRSFVVGALNANLNSAFEVPTLDSLMTGNPPRVFELYRRYANPGANIFLRGATRLPPEPVLDAAAIGTVTVRRVLEERIAEADARGYPTVFDDGYVRIYARRTEPRCTFSSDLTLVAPAEALERVADPRRPREVLLEAAALPVPSSPNRDDDPAVRVVGWHRNSLTLAVEAPRDGVVYCADSFFTGWSATVDGRPSEILPADFAFRAVPVRRGRRRVHLAYWPPGLTPGLWITGCAALLGAGVLVGRRRREPPREASLRPPPT